MDVIRIILLANIEMQEVTLMSENNDHGHK